MGIDLISLASFGTGLIDSGFSYSANREQAKISKKTLSEQIKEYQAQRGQLEEAYSYKNKLIGDIYGRRMDETRTAFGNKEFGINRKTEDTAGRTGLAYSGTVEEKGEYEMSTLKDEFASSLNQLKDTLASTQFQSTMERDKVLSDLDITISGLKGQKRAAKAADDQKFLGIF